MMTFLQHWIALLIELLSLFMPIPQSIYEQYGIKHPHEEEFVGTWVTDDGGIVVFNNDSTIAYHNILWNKIIHRAALPMDGIGTWCLGKTDLNNYYIDIAIPQENTVYYYYRTFVLIKGSKLFNKVLPMQMVYCSSNQDAFPTWYTLKKSGK